MRQNISLLQFFTSLIFGIYAFIELIHFNVTILDKTQFLYMTTWNYYISSIYLIVISICDFSLYILKSNKLDIVNEIFRENLSPSFTAITYLVSITFWMIIFPMIISNGEDGNFGVGPYMNLYIHLFLTIFQTIDIFISYRKQKGIVIKYDFLIAVFILGAYALLSLILIYGFDKRVYPFFNNLTWYIFIGLFLFFAILIFVSYLIFVGLIKLKYKLKIFIIKDDSNNNEISISDEETNKENKENKDSI